MGMLDRVGTGEYAIPERIDPLRTELRDEFMADPYAVHSVELQLPLAAMRSNRHVPRWILLTKEPGRSWLLAEAPKRRGEPPRIAPDLVFTDQADAERYVFGLRWQALTGEEPAGE
jgi:ribosomal protein L39E